MTHTTEGILDGAIQLDHYSDLYTAHYLLPGDRFDQDREILNLILQHGGTCCEGWRKNAPANMQCNFDCEHCNQSIYYQAQLKKRFFDRKAAALCEKEPQSGDCWELSLGFVDDSPEEKYQTFYFAALQNVLGFGSILNLTVCTVESYVPNFIEEARFIFLKIKRYDTTDALDVSEVARAKFHQSKCIA